MKPLLLASIAILFSFNAQAQEIAASSHWVAGGSIGTFFQKERLGLHSFIMPISLRPRWDDSRSRHLAVNGLLGRVIKPWWMLGAQCTYEKSRSILNTPVNHQRTAFYDLYSRETIFNIGMFSRFTLNPRNRLQGYFQISPLLSLSKASIGTASEVTEAHRDDWILIAFSAGARLVVNPKIAVFLNVGGIDYLLHSFNKVVTADLLTSDHFVLNFRPTSVQIGIDTTF